MQRINDTTFTIAGYTFSTTQPCSVYKGKRKQPLLEMVAALNIPHTQKDTATALCDKIKDHIKKLPHAPSRPHTQHAPVPAPSVPHPKDKSSDVRRVPGGLFYKGKEYSLTNCDKFIPKFKLDDLKKIAKDLGLSSDGAKKVICERIRGMKPGHAPAKAPSPAKHPTPKPAGVETKQELNKLTIPLLKALAKTRGIKLKKGDKKADIIQALLKAKPPTPAKSPTPAKEPSPAKSPSPAKAPSPEKPAETQKELDKHSVKELKALAKKKGISLSGLKNKAEFIQKIKKASDPTKPHTPAKTPTDTDKVERRSPTLHPSHPETMSAQEIREAIRKCLKLPA